MAQKRTLDSFFSVPSKKPRLAAPTGTISPPLLATDEPIPPVATSDPPTSSEDSPYLSPSTHPAYPIPIPQLPSALLSELSHCPSDSGKSITNAPDLDLLHFSPFFPSQVSQELFRFLRRELPFYRVQYTVKRGSVETQINTPRYTTVFGVDASAHFSEEGKLVSAASKTPLAPEIYPCRPRPIPQCLDVLRILTEAVTGETYNFCLVNYYASGSDSISYHSDDEKFLGQDPAIASFSLGARRDFLMKHKAPDGNEKDGAGKKAGLGAMETRKFPLASGDMILMRGRTQANWLHSLPKRKGGEADGGRINITFRKALVRGGTGNYYRYNVGDGGVFRWDERRREMVPWQESRK